MSKKSQNHQADNQPVHECTNYDDKFGILFRKINYPFLYSAILCDVFVTSFIKKSCPSSNSLSTCFE